MNNSKHDTFLNVGLIAAGLVGLFLGILQGPSPADADATVASLVLSEGRA